MHLPVQIQSEGRQTFGNDRPQGLEIEIGVPERGIELHFVQEIGEIRKIIESEFDIGLKIGVTVVEDEVVGPDAGTVHKSIQTAGLDVEAKVFFPQRKPVDPGGDGFIVTDVACVKMDILEVQAVG